MGTFQKILTICIWNQIVSLYTTKFFGEIKVGLKQILRKNEVKTEF